MTAVIVRSYKYKPKTIKEAFSVIGLFLNERCGLGVSEVARRVSLPKSTVFGILEDLTKEGWIAKDPANKKYGLGTGLLDLAWQVSGQKGSFVNLVRMKDNEVNGLTAGADLSLNQLNVA